MNEWKALTGRIVLFLAPSPITLPSMLELYKQIWGGDPDNFQKSENALVPSVVHGKSDGMMVQCSIHPTRIDFILGPLPPKRQIENKLQAIEDSSKLYAELGRIINIIGDDKVIKNPVNRVALALQVINPKSSVTEANMALAKVIPDQYGIKIDNEEDLVFQINTPYISNKVQNIKMNTLTRWGVDKIHIVSLLLPVSGSSTANDFSQTKEFITASVTFDNNTSLENSSSFSNKQQSELLAEALATTAKRQKDIGLNMQGF